MIMATQVSFYDDFLKKRISGSYSTSGNLVIVSSAYGFTTMAQTGDTPPTAVACMLLTEMARTAAKEGRFIMATR
jgi:hypothetical protein